MAETLLFPPFQIFNRWLDLVQDVIFFINFVLHIAVEHSNTVVPAVMAGVCLPCIATAWPVAEKAMAGLAYS